MSDQDGAFGRTAELDKCGEHLIDFRRFRDHRISDSGQHRDEWWDSGSGIDESLKLSDYLTATNLHRANFSDRAIFG